VSNWSPGKINAVPIYNGIDFSEVPEPKNSYEPKTIISAGRLIKIKNFDFLIRTIKDMPEWKLFIAGDGPDKENLKSQISNLSDGEADLKLQDRVFMLGNLDRESLMKKMQESQIFINSSISESFSFVTVEAMRAGIPVIATNVGGLPEIIENGKEGILIKPNDKEELLKAIQKMENKEFRETLLMSAIKKTEMFSIDNTLSKTSDLIKEMAQ
jgi:glycosyltransferase involved in cell wall biosynthesis